MPETSNTNRRTKKSVPVDNTYGHLPPQALDLERVVLGALMIDKDAFAVVSEMLHPCGHTCPQVLGSPAYFFCQ